eukprot:jgi/Botrbrau1/19136/Bobra.0077s0048.1
MPGTCAIALFLEGSVAQNICPWVTCILRAPGVVVVPLPSPEKGSGTYSMCGPQHAQRDSHRSVVADGERCISKVWAPARTAWQPQEWWLMGNAVSQRCGPQHAQRDSQGLYQCTTACIHKQWLMGDVRAGTAPSRQLLMPALVFWAFLVLVFDALLPLFLLIVGSCSIVPRGWSF